MVKMQRASNDLVSVTDHKINVVFNNGAWECELFDQLTHFPLHPSDDYVDSLAYGLHYFTSHLENRRTSIQDSSHSSKIWLNHLTRCDT